MELVKEKHLYTGIAVGTTVTAKVHSDGSFVSNAVDGEVVVEDERMTITLLAKPGKSVKVEVVGAWVSITASGLGASVELTGESVAVQGINSKENPFVFAEGGRNMTVEPEMGAFSEVCCRMNSFRLKAVGNDANLTVIGLPETATTNNSQTSVEKSLTGNFDNLASFTVTAEELLIYTRVSVNGKIGKAMGYFKESNQTVAVPQQMTVKTPSKEKLVPA